MAKASGLETILTQLMKSGTLNAIGSATGANKDEVKSVLETAVPALLGSMAENAGSKTGAKELAKALDDHADTGTSLARMLTDGVDMEDGAKIVGHLLGGKNDSATKAISKKSGVDLQKVAGILAIVAPILMRIMGNAKQQTNTDANDLTSLLGALLGGSGTSSSEKDDDNTAGGLVGSLLGAALGGNGKNDDNGNVLGSLLGAAIGANNGNGKKDDTTAELVGSLLTSFLK